MTKLGALLILIAACKGGDDKAKSSGAGASGKGGCETTAAKPAELVAGKAPQLLAPLDKLTLGMSPADAAKVCPNFFQGDDAKKAGTFSVGEIVGKFGETYAQARLEFLGDKLDQVSFSLPADVADALTAAWGKPVESTGSPPAHAWFNEATRTRAILGPAESDGRRELDVSSYAPLAAFVEADTKTIAWKPQDVLSKQPKELAKLFPQYLRADETSAAVKKQTEEMMKDLNKEVEALGVNTKRDADLPEFRLPAAPFQDGTRTHVMLYTNDDGGVRSYGLWFRTANLSPAYGFPQQSADLIKKLDEMYGPHKTVKETLGERKMWFDAKQGLRAFSRVEKPEELDVVYGRYLPLAAFFGAPGTVWGFEKPERPLLGATVDQIQATYGKLAEVKHNERAKMITLSLPPTDYVGDTSSTTIMMHLDDGGKVRQWRVSIPFDDYEPAKAEYEALLTAKFGKAKPADRDHLIYSKKPTVDVQYSKYTHDLDIQVSK